MAQLTCELCGGTNLLKQDGVFVCQDCGCKYTLEEARKIMNGGAGVPAAAEPAASTESKKLANLYQLARRAKDEDNSENAAKYYEQIMLEEPDSWEAAFYQTYYTAMQCKIGQIASAANLVTSCLENVFGLIRDKVTDEEAQSSAVSEVTARVVLISNMLFNAAQNHYNQFSSTSNAYSEFSNRAEAALNMLYVGGQTVEKNFDNFACAYAMYYAGSQKAESSWVVSKYKSVFDNKITEMKNNRKEKYWEEHAEEKARLEAEKESLQTQIDEKNARKDKCSAADRLAKCRERHDELVKEKNALGLFKGKEKKAVQEKIDAENAEMSRWQSEVDKYNSAIDEEIKPLLDRISEINAEFEADR